MNFFDVDYVYDNDIDNNHNNDVDDNYDDNDDDYDNYDDDDEDDDVQVYSAGRRALIEERQKREPSRLERSSALPSPSSSS